MSLENSSSLKVTLMMTYMIYSETMKG